MPEGPHGVEQVRHRPAPVVERPRARPSRSRRCDRPTRRCRARRGPRSRRPRRRARVRASAWSQGSRRGAAPPPRRGRACAATPPGVPRRARATGTGPRDARPGSARARRARSPADREERPERLLGCARDDRRLVPQDAVTGERAPHLDEIPRLGAQHVDARVAVHLEIDEAGDRDAPAAPASPTAATRPDSTSTSPRTRPPSTTAAATPRRTAQAYGGLLGRGRSNRYRGARGVTLPVRSRGTPRGGHRRVERHRAGDRRRARPRRRGRGGDRARAGSRHRRAGAGTRPVGAHARGRHRQARGCRPARRRGVGGVRRHRHLGQQRRRAARAAAPGDDRRGLARPAGRQPARLLLRLPRGRPGDDRRRAPAGGSSTSARPRTSSRSPTCPPTRRPRAASSR